MRVQKNTYTHKKSKFKTYISGLRSYVTVEVAVLGSPSLISLMVSVDVIKAE